MLKIIPVVICVFLAFIISILTNSSIISILIFWIALIVFIQTTDLFNPKHMSLEKKKEINFLKNLFIISIVIRLGLSAFLHASDHSIFNPYFFAPDSYYYAHKGWHIAQLWMKTISEYTYNATISSWGNNIYFYFHAVCYFLIGKKEEFLPASFNCLIGSLIPIASYLIAKEFGVHRKCASLVAIFIAFWPSLILWSTIGIRDIWSILSFNVLLLCYMKFVKSNNILYLIIISLCLLLIFSIRPYLLPLTLLALFSSFFISKSKNLPALFFLSIFAIIIVNQIDAAFNISRFLEPDTIVMYRKAFGGKASGFLTNVDLSSPIGYVKMISVSLLYYFFAPFPWDIFESKLRTFAFPETFLIYLTFYYMVRGIIMQWKIRAGEVVPLILLFFVISISYSIIEANYGTLFRHRAQVLTLLLIFVPIGFYYRKIPLAKVGKKNIKF